MVRVKAFLIRFVGNLQQRRSASCWTLSGLPYIVTEGLTTTCTATTARAVKVLYLR